MIVRAIRVAFLNVEIARLFAIHIIHRSGARHALIAVCSATVIKAASIHSRYAHKLCCGRGSMNAVITVMLFLMSIVRRLAGESAKALDPAIV